MKYLKLFETNIKHSNPMALNHILRDFSRKIEDMVILLKELDNFDNSTVKRYFDDNGEIRIVYKYSYHKLLKVSMRVQSQMIDFVITDTAINSWNEKYIENSLNFFDIINFQLREYKTKDDNYGSEINHVHYTFSINKINEILNKLLIYEQEILNNKFNI